MRLGLVPRDCQPSLIDHVDGGLDWLGRVQRQLFLEQRVKLFWRGIVLALPKAPFPTDEGGSVTTIAKRLDGAVS